VDGGFAAAPRRLLVVSICCGSSTQLVSVHGWLVGMAGTGFDQVQMRWLFLLTTFRCGVCRAEVASRFG